MRALLFTSLALVACNKENPDYCPAHPGEDGCPGGGSNDGGVDAPDIDADPSIDARLDFGSGAYAVKLLGPAPGPKTITQEIMTNGADCSPDQLWVSLAQPGSCFIVATKITISTSIEVHGPRPLVLVATDSIVLSGTLDAAGHVGGNPPAASPETTCIGPATTLVTDGGGGSGGAGASFMTKGGDGAYGAGNTTAIVGLAGDALTSAPTILRAGCKGQAGAAGGTGGAGGDGGGAVYLLAGNTIDLRAGTVNASGSGGNAGTGRGGGGGAGSGGMIVLSAPTILTDSASRLVANGGGGASGANGGAAGGEPITATPDTPALGATAGNCGDGGNGSTTDGGGPGLPGASNCGGGGGGGGAGFIQTSVTLTSGAYSPAPVPL